MTVGNGGLFSQCFECMRVCPVATNAPLADPLKRGAAQRAERSPESAEWRRQRDVSGSALRAEMIDAFGPIIFDLDANVQDRSGDPVRLLDFKEIERQRAGAGLADAEIAARLGLAVDQVTFIRVLLEQRRFKPERYYRLFQLGGGRRFRIEQGGRGARPLRRDPVQPRRDGHSRRHALSTGPRAARSGDRPLAGSKTTATWLTWARETPEATAIAAPGFSPISYAAALDRAERLAAALAALGLRRGDVISVRLPSTPEFVVIYYAVARLGGVLSTLHTPYGAGEAEPILRHARHSAVFCGAATEKSDPPGMFEALAQRLPGLRHIISVGPPRASVLSLDALIASADRAVLPPLPVATDAALMCYTSGTSTAPKAVPHSFQSMLANPRQCLPVFETSSPATAC